MELGKRYDTTDTTDFSTRELVRTCYGLATGKWIMAFNTPIFAEKNYIPSWATAECGYIMLENFIGHVFRTLS